jgi:uncharacterized membrane protein
MNKLFTFVLFCGMTFMVYAQEITVIQSPGNDAYYALGMSSDGAYIAGQVGNQHHLFAWKKGATAAVERDDDAYNASQQDRANARGVSKNGLVAGICPNPEYYYPNEMGQYQQSNVAMAAVFNYETPAWSFLEVPASFGMAGNPAAGYGSQAWAINDDGTVVVGGQTRGGEAVRRQAAVWKGTSPDNLTYTALTADKLGSRGSVAKAVSGNGNVIGGFKGSDSSFDPVPVLWIWNESTHNYVETLIPGASIGSVEGISNNGKYAVVSVKTDIGRAYLYAIEETKLTEISTQASAALAVSDNGVVTGHFGALGYPTSPFGLGTLALGYQVQDADGAFIYTREMGVKPLSDFFDENGITYPAGFTFKAVTAISADGKIICGFGTLGDKTVSFQVEIPVINSLGAFTPNNFTVESPAYGSVKLAWDAVPEDPAFTGYKIYSGGNLIHTTSATETSYTVEGLADGTYNYTIVSSYTNKEADPTRSQRITVGKHTLPITEEFNYSGRSSEVLRNNYWDISSNQQPLGSVWSIQPEAGLPVPALQFFVPVGGTFSESVTSPYFDASSSDNLYLSFVVATSGANIGVNNYQLAIETFDGTAWTTLETISVSAANNNKFGGYSYELSQLAHKDNVRFRFRCYGEANGLDLSWFIDNVEFTDAPFELAKPLVISARAVEETGMVHVNWADPKGHVLLKYLNNEWVHDGVGNEGVPFIAANKYAAEDLIAYEGYQLTSLSFYRDTNTEAAIPTAPTFKWYVSQGDERIFEEPVNHPEMGWNTINLSNPITIDVTKPLYYGVEVVTHHAQDLPVGVGVNYTPDFENEIYNATTYDYGRANLFSENGGTTWQRLDEAGVEYALFYVQATLDKVPGTAPKDRLLGYKVFRNGVNLLDEEFGTGSLTQLNNYTDREPLAGQEACYTIYADYNSLNLSEGVTACVTMGDVGLIPIEEGTKAYPNLIGKNEILTVELSGDWNNAVIALYDLSGKKIKTAKATGQKTPVQLNVNAGIYILKVNDTDAVKIVVK